jgi:hypothetical protein
VTAQTQIAPTACATCGQPPRWDAVKGWVCDTCSAVIQARRARWSEDPRAYKRQYNREHRAGLRRTAGKRPVLVRLLEKLNRDPGELVVPALGPCWVWLGARNASGYGVIRDDTGQLALVHRIALAAALGRDLIDGMLACHRCDYPRCARPRHLYEGTPLDNVADMVARDRAAWSRPEATA